jgi:hypothetical protein
MPRPTRNSESGRQRRPSEPDTTGTKAAAKEKDERKSAALLADMQRAQLEFSKTAEETYRQAILRSSGAYQEYLEAISPAQAELYRHAFEALQAFTTSMNVASDPGDVAKQSADAYERYVTAVRDLFDTSEALAKAQEADANYLKAVSEAQGQPESEARLTEAYATYLTDIRNAWDKSAEMQEVNTTLQAWLDLLKLAQGQYQKQAFEGYSAYIEALRRAPTETDAFERSERAHASYLKALHEIWESTRESLGKAAASTVLKTLQRAWSSG